MRKSTRIVKRVLALFLVVLMSINTLGAVVSDNDGSAFITKAEFDSLKNNFQSQIDQYNTSIDSKIDGAIASYLAGINVAKKSIISCPVANYNTIRWSNGVWAKHIYRKYSSRTAYSESVDKYQEINFLKYRSLRAQRLYLACGRMRDVRTFFQNFVLGEANRYVSSQANGYAIYGSGEGITTYRNPPIYFFCELKEENGEWTFNRDETDESSILKAESWMVDTASGNINGDNHGSSSGGWYDGNLKPGISNTEGTRINILASGTNYLKWNVYIADQNNNTQQFNNQYLNASNFNLGSIVYIDPLPVTAGSQYSQLPMTTYHRNIELGYTYFPSGLNQAKSDMQRINYLMLGNNFEQTINYTQRRVDVQLGGQDFYDWTGADIVETNFNVAYVKIYADNYRSNLANPAGTSAFIFGNGTSDSFTIGLPVFRRKDIGTLKNHKFIYNNKYLQLNQGLPIVIETTAKGDLKLKLKYKVYDADLSNSAEPSQNVLLSLKKGDFTSQVNSDYYKDDAGTLYNNVLITSNSSSDTEIEIKIPMEKQDNMWLRIGPEDLNPSGKYVVISNLSMEYEEE
ncbi:MAG: hypothetical protein J6M39_02180 [Lachnospiraceae bacterium]|nr:hypothetical protein [Lachnospiraceae bacterium]